MVWTQKKENFCMAYIRLGDASAAYREAYNTKRMKPQVVWSRASELLNNGEVTVRLNELRAPALEKANVTVEWIVGNLVEIVERSMQRAPVEDASGVQIECYICYTNIAYPSILLYGTRRRPKLALFRAKMCSCMAERKTRRI